MHGRWTQASAAIDSTSSLKAMKNTCKCSADEDKLDRSDDDDQLLGPGIDTQSGDRVVVEWK